MKKILISAAHFSEVKGFWEAFGLEKRVFKGKPVTIVRFEKEVTLIIIGIGFKEGSLQVNEILKNFSLTDLVLNVGSAGSLYPGLDPGDCFIPDKFVYDREEESLDSNQLLEKKCPQTVFNILKDKKIKFKTGTLLTVKEPVESSKAVEKLKSLYNVSAVDMEAFYLAEGASQNNIPFTSLKIISDRADGSTQVDFKKYLPDVSAIIGTILHQLIKEI